MADRIPLQNRVLPTGDIVSHPSKEGAFTGNRGIIHVADRQLGTARWSHQAWICCTLDWQGRRRELMTGRKWTELFFLDEAVAMAAGHRPCGYCRRSAYRSFADRWAEATGRHDSAKEMDRSLHAARIVKGTKTQKRHVAPVDDLPDGSFVTIEAGPALILGDRLLPYSPEGYAPPIPRPTGETAEVLTPAPMVAVLRAGFQPVLHRSALL